MNVKTGTQTWSTAAQDQGFKADNSHSVGARPDLGAESVGDVLNKIADPNYVDPEKTRKVGNNQLDKDAFFKLMLTQMKFQDPTNPMQSHEMAAQLASFTSLEQLQNINSTLDGMKKEQNPQTNFQALNFIGKKVSGDSSRLVRTPGDKSHSISFNLAGDAMKAKVTIRDSAGATVQTLEFPNLKKGQNSVKWNGLTKDGLPARPDEYKINIEGTNSSGKKVFATTDFSGRITGVNFSAEGPILLLGQQTVRLSDVKKIVEAGPDDLKALPLTMPSAVPASKSDTGAAPAKGNNRNQKSAQDGSLVVKNESDKKPLSAAPLAAYAKATAQANPNSIVNSAPAQAEAVSEQNASVAQDEEEVPGAPDYESTGNMQNVAMSRNVMQELEKAKN